MAQKKSTKMDFEKSLENLDQVVAQLESGELSLEESLKLFEQGIKLTRQCQQALQKAEEKITILTQQNSEWLVDSEEEVGEFIEGPR